ncbi:MAG: FG-GAP repeat domain-containing protein, partial [Planctomycetota bacterium]
FADLDGDGKAELITGKRWYAHNGGDPGGQEPPCLYYYTWNGHAFTRHVIDEGHIGTGLQIRTGDLNGDGRADIAVAGKSGTYLILSK